MSDWLKFVLAAAQFGAAAGLAWRGLASQHLALVLLLLFLGLMNVLVAGMPFGSSGYLRAWALSLAVQSILLVWMGVQAYSRSLETTPRVRRLSHQILLATCGLAALFSQLAQETFTPFGIFSRVFQGVSLALGFFCLGMLPVIQRYYSPRRRPNAVAHEWILTAYYLAGALSLLATHWQAVPLNQWIAFAANFGCAVAWFVCLRKDGETLPPPPAEREGDGRVKLSAQNQFEAVAKELKSVTRSN